MALSEETKLKLKKNRQIDTPVDDAPYTHAEEIADLNNTAYYDEVSQSSDTVAIETRSQELQQHEVTPEELEFIPQNGGDITSANVVYGVDKMTPELLESVFTYLGVTPKPVGNYTGRWIPLLGCVIAPLDGDVSRVDRVTGEVETEHITWDAPLFKIASIDDTTGMHVVLSGGGTYGMKFARSLLQVFGPGDFPVKCEMLISQEERQGVDPETHQLKPRRMFRFAYRAARGAK